MRRFWDKVQRGPASECWLWTACTFAGTGYGCFGLGGRNRSAHRVSWELTNGPIPDGLCVLHHCDVKACVNPRHLFLGTHQDNSRDMARKGRGGRPLKFDRQTATELRRVGLSQREIARRLGVTQPAVSYFLRGALRDKPANDISLRSA